LASTLSVVPLYGDNSFSIIGYSVGEFLRVLTSIISNKWVKVCIHGFANISMTTAFLGVSLGLFDFLADGFKRSNTRWGRLQTAGLTFLPPMLLNLLFPSASNFIKAFNYSGIFVAILFLILPPIIVYRLRKKPVLTHVPLNYAKFGKASFAVIIVLGFVFTIFPILTSLGFFPAVK